MDNEEYKAYLFAELMRQWAEDQVRAINDLIKSTNELRVQLVRNQAIVDKRYYFDAIDADRYVAIQRN
jgi:hypothetical protein